MTDPMDALKSFQTEMAGVGVPVQPGSVYPDIYVHLDYPNDIPRFTYVTLVGRTVTALAVFVLVDPLDGKPCFQVGYAVPEEFRGNGYAKNIVAKAIEELATGMGRTGMKSFSVEAVVGIDNQASRQVAGAVLSESPSDAVDHETGEAALHFVLKVDTNR